MEVIRIEFQPSIKEKILELLSTFSPDEVKIIPEQTTFEQDKRRLHASAEKIHNGTAQFCSVDELDLFLEKIITSYEN
jgi:hypothetical protein